MLFLAMNSHLSLKRGATAPFSLVRIWYNIELNLCLTSSVNTSYVKIEVLSFCVSVKYMGVYVKVFLSIHFKI
jgi:hypothetical protein